ncbi:hypothetical protein [Candidatus Magnetomonas plexicatena]|uniref:hypothetical protein n=1 Tax=Candidatus Magnetomonas plexicatena TaxID=2552947 RepID=UPI0011012509|nr:hypothetical protein E2O03_015110 [Nitrospirales bacterium LBB_01]
MDGLHLHRCVIRHRINNYNHSSILNTTHTLTVPTTTLVSLGGYVGPFSSTITNNTSSTYYMYLYVYTPGGSWLVLNSGQTISAGQTLSASNLYSYVPYAAQTGTYYYFEITYDSSWNQYEYKYFTYTVN